MAGGASFDRARWIDHNADLARTGAWEEIWMIVVNFSHPPTPQQCAEIERQVQAPVERVIEVRTHFDEEQPFASQVEALVEMFWRRTPECWRRSSR